MRSTLLRIVLPVLGALAAVPAGTARAATRPVTHGWRYQAITAVRQGAFDMLLVARGPCGHRPQHDCDEMFRSFDAGRSWTKTPRPPGRLSESTLTAVGPESAWLTETPLHGAALTYATTDDGASWRRLRLTNIESVVAVGSTVYAAKAHSLYAGTSQAGSLRWIGPSVGGQLAAVRGAVYNYRAPYDRWRLHGRLRVTVIRGRTIAAGPAPCRRSGALNVAVSGNADGSVLAVCVGEPAMGEQLKRSFVSEDGGTTWRRTSNPLPFGYTGSVAAHGTAGTFVATGRSRLQATYDDGRSWHLLNIGAPAAADGEWQVGFDTSGEYGYGLDSQAPWAFYLTDDGGRTWHRAARAELHR